MKEDVRILIIKMSSLGDIIHALPTLYALRQQYPKAHIAWAVHEQFKDVIPPKPWVDEIIIIDKKRLKRLSYWKQLWKLLHEKHFDISLDLQSIAKSAIVAGLSGAKKRYAYWELREGSWLVNTALVGDHKMDHVIERYLDTARALGCDVDDIVFPLPTFAEAETAVTQKLNARGAFIENPYIVMAPGARWAVKEWPISHFVDLGKRLVAAGETVVLIGAKEDADKGRAIVDGVGSDNVVNLIGDTNLKELIEVIRHSALFISADTGPLHIANALKVPLIALFGTTCPDRTGPYGGDHVHVILSPTSRATLENPLVEDLECMAQITVDTVFDTVKEMRNL